jgi:hypothetical protein
MSSVTTLPHWATRSSSITCLLQCVSRPYEAALLISISSVRFAWTSSRVSGELLEAQG